MGEETKNYFVELNSLNITGHTEKKGGLTYLSWPWAWGELKKADPSANYKIYENRDELNYFHDDRSAWVKVGVTAFGIEHVEMLPVMDYNNRSIPLDKITSFDVNKAIQRCLTKAIARHGIGLYIYAGEDLPEEPKPEPTPAAKKKKEAAPKADQAPQPEAPRPIIDIVTDIGNILKVMKAKSGSLAEYQEIVIKVTGKADFKCKNATEGDRATVESILAALKEKGW